MVPALQANIENDEVAADKTAKKKEKKKRPTPAADAEQPAPEAEPEAEPVAKKKKKNQAKRSATAVETEPNAEPEEMTDAAAQNETGRDARPSKQVCGVCELTERMIAAVWAHLPVRPDH